MSKEKLVAWHWQEKAKVLRKKSVPVPFAHHKSHMEWPRIEPGLQSLQAFLKQKENAWWCTCDASLLTSSSVYPPCTQLASTLVTSRYNVQCLTQHMVLTSFTTLTVIRCHLPYCFILSLAYSNNVWVLLQTENMAGAVKKLSVQLEITSK
jgi:hypothetical protein